MRPRREGDEAYGMSDSEAAGYGSDAAAARARSPDLSRTGARSPTRTAPIAGPITAVVGPGPGPGPVAVTATRAMSPTQGLNGTVSPGSGGLPINAAAQRVRNGVSGARSPSPGMDRGAPPADAFKYKGSSSPITAQRPGSTGNITADLVRDVRAKEGELETMKRREAWLRAALTRAKKDGFALVDAEPDDGQEAVEDYANEDMKRISELALKLKQERSKIQVRFSVMDPTSCNR